MRGTLFVAQNSAGELASHHSSAHVGNYAIYTCSLCFHVSISKARLLRISPAERACLTLTSFSVTALCYWPRSYDVVRGVLLVPMAMAWGRVLGLLVRLWEVEARPLL